MLTAAGGTLSRGKLHLLGWVADYLGVIPAPENLEWNGHVRCEEIDWYLAALTNDHVLGYEVHEIDEETAYIEFSSTVIEGEEEEVLISLLEPEHLVLRALGRATWAMVHTPDKDPWAYALKYKPPEEDMPEMTPEHVEEAKSLLETLKGVECE